VVPRRPSASETYHDCVLSHSDSMISGRRVWQGDAVVAVVVAAAVVVVAVVVVVAAVAAPVSAAAVALMASAVVSLSLSRALDEAMLVIGAHREE
jgi:hypothetical protein